MPELPRNRRRNWPRRRTGRNLPPPHGVPHGNDWPPLEYGELILRQKSQSRTRNAGRRMRVPTVGDSFRPAGRLGAWFGIGEPRWSLALEDPAELAVRLPTRLRYHTAGTACRRPDHLRAYALDSLFTVLPYLVCKRCGHRLEWPNFACGSRVHTPNWQSRVLHQVLRLLLRRRR